MLTSNTTKTGTRFAYKINNRQPKHCRVHCKGLAVGQLQKVLVLERNTYLKGTCIQNNYWKGTLHDNTCQVMLKEKKAVADDHKEEPKRTL